MLVDANILLYAVDEASPFHQQARAGLAAQFSEIRWTNPVAPQ